MAAFPAAVRALVSPGIAAVRWGAVGYGVVVVAARAGRNGWGDVAAVAVCVFLTALRTLLPLELGNRSLWVRSEALLDVAVFALAAGWTGGTQSPWVFCAAAAVGVGALGWGWAMGALGALTAFVAVVAATLASDVETTDLLSSEASVAVTAFVALAAVAGAVVRDRIIDAETRRRAATGEFDGLLRANRLLGELSEVALTLPGSFTMREALGRVRQQLATFMDPVVVALVTFEEHSDEWTPKITDRCGLRTAYSAENLPEPLGEVVRDGVVVDRDHLGPADARLAAGSGAGVYLPLRTRGRVIGVLGLEHPQPGHFASVDPVLRDGLCDAIALTVDNARWFGRLRSLGAEEERIRVARDLHDRLGQWMTYIKLELERLTSAGTVDRSELERLHDDAAAALDELRETLLQLRSGVSDDRPLSVLARDLVARFADRTDVAARFHASHPDQRLPVPVENELLRILQEALNNVDRHAKADHVEVTWKVDGGNYELLVVDDGRGFDPERAVREQAYGMVGMRERAEVIGANLRVSSSPGHGTRVRVAAGRIEDPGTDPGIAEHGDGGGKDVWSGPVRAPAPVDPGEPGSHEGPSR